jgi:hypothetical protein
MIRGFGSYSERGGVIQARETASSQRRGAELAVRGRAGRNVETASGGAAVSSMGFGGLTADDLSLSYIGGSASRNTQNTYSAPPEVYNYYAAIFREDHVCGAAVELRSNIPYAAGMRLSGTKDASRLKVYQDTVSALRMESMMARISIERDAMGAFFGSLDFNAEKKTFDSILPLSRLDITKIKYPPVHGLDPVVDVKPSQLIMDLLADANDPRVKPLLDCVPDFLKTAQGTNGVAVPSKNLVWIARPHIDPRYNSIYHRILPIFLIERALMRGTIEGAHRRQKPILHLMLGQGEEWAPTPEEFDFVSGLFTDADADPLGAIVATRDNISVNEVRSPQDFWKITDISDQTLTFKLRALGISEAFLSADASFANADSAVTVFIEGLRAERNQVEKQVFYDKLFPQIAMANSFFKGKKGAAGSNMSLNSIDDISNLDVPTVEWRRSLQPEGDGAYMDLLAALEAHNVPIPVRMFAAASGIDLNTLLEASEQDVKDRKAIADWREKIKEFQPEDPAMMGAEGGGEFARASLFDALASPNSLRPIGVLNRDYGDVERYDHAPLDGRGHRQPASKKWKLEKRDEIHRLLARVTAQVAQKENYHARQRGLLVDGQV